MAAALMKYKLLTLYNNEDDMRLLQKARQKYLSEKRKERLTDRNVLVAALEKYTNEGK